MSKETLSSIIKNGTRVKSVTMLATGRVFEPGITFEDTKIYRMAQSKTGSIVVEIGDKDSSKFESYVTFSSKRIKKIEYYR